MEYLSIFEHTGTAMAIIEEDTTLSLVNAEFERLSGYTKEEIEGKKSWTEFVLKDDQERMKEYHRLRRTDPTLAPSSYEFRFIDREGKVKDILLTIGMIPGTKRSVASLLEVTDRKRAEEALRESEEKFKAILENVHDVIFQLSPSGLIQYVSPNVEKLYGYKPEDLIGQHLSRTTPATEVPKALKALNSVLSGKVVRGFEINQLDSKGNIIPMEINITPLKKDGRIISVQGVMRDVTDRKRAEEAIIRAKQEWESTFDTIEEMILLTDAEGRIRRANRMVAKKVGIETKDLIGKRCEEVFSCGCAGTKNCSLWRLKMKMDVSPREFEITSLGIWARSMSYASYTSEGELDYVVHIYRDITEEKWKEEALRRTEEQLRIIMEGASDGFTYVDRNGVILFANKKMKEILADPNPEGKPLGMFYDEKNREILARNLEKRWRGKGTVYKIELTDLMGKKHHMLVWGVPHRDKNGIVQGAFGIYHDITKEREAEEVLSKYKEALNKSFFGIAEALSKVIEDRDPYTSGHSAGVARLSVAISRVMGYSEEEVTGIYISGILHDIGKMSIPVEILVKPGKLSELEMSLIRTHPQSGYDILKEIDFPWPVAQITLQHHERMDGSGYPRGLKGEEIILGARILAVADVVDAMTHHRPYRPARSLEEAIQELRQGKGRLYDPQVVDACLEVLKEGEPLSPQNTQ